MIKPQFHSVSEFLQMGGYASFVFSSYFLGFLAVFGLLYFVFSSQNKWKSRLEELEGKKGKNENG